MILVITAQDAATRDNLLVAGGLAVGATVALLEHQAVRANVMAELTLAPTSPLLIFSHGRPGHLVGHDNNPSVSQEDIALLRNRESFAFACYTAASMGPTISEAGGTWFGFAGPVNCLPADADVRPHFEAIANFIANRFPGCTTTPAATHFVSDLNTLVDEAFAEIDESGLATFEQLHALRDITRRLRIFIHGVEGAIKHWEAFSDPIL